MLTITKLISMKQSIQFTINSLIFIFFLKNSIIKIIIYKKHKKQNTGNTVLSICLGPLAIIRVTKGVITSNTLNNITYFVFFNSKTSLIIDISKIVNHIAETNKNTKNAKKDNGDISSPFKLIIKVLIIFKALK